jgi:hypothetical protein
MKKGKRIHKHKPKEKLKSELLIIRLTKADSNLLSNYCSKNNTNKSKVIRELLKSL